MVKMVKIGSKLLKWAVNYSNFYNIFIIENFSLSLNPYLSFLIPNFLSPIPPHISITYHPLLSLIPYPESIIPYSLSYIPYPVFLFPFPFFLIPFPYPSLISYPLFIYRIQDYTKQWACEFVVLWNLHIYWAAYAAKNANKIFICIMKLYILLGHLLLR